MARTNTIRTNANDETLGAAIAVIENVRTLKDGGARVTIDIGAEDTQLIEKLLRLKMIGNGLISVAFVRANQSDSGYEEF